MKNSASQGSKELREPFPPKCVPGLRQENTLANVAVSNYLIQGKSLKAVLVGLPLASQSGKMPLLTILIILLVW